MDDVLREILARLEAAMLNGGRLLLVIDGRCGSGKTTLAQEFGCRCRCNVFHMDDYYLPVVQQTEERLAEPGGNIDFERFAAEVALPLMQGRDIICRPFACSSQSYMEATLFRAAKINIIEGTYSCHPRLHPIYESAPDVNVVTLFLDIDSDIQLERIQKRVGEQRLQMFKEKWIPREEQYFDAYAVREYCDYRCMVTENIIDS